ncbi:Npun_F0494 family protein [Aphanothece stagnina]|uniref:Npun_F0494 family protein n=1 Tax=Aphanothece stagnina TaxID=1004305 RepID=UPI00398F67A5
MTSLSPLLRDDRARSRAAQALRCLPFRRAFYERVASEPLSSTAFCRLPEAGQLCRGRLSSQGVEEHWLWLIRLGVLRREVDGQGLTERVRLTPMGRELLQLWPGEIPPAPLLERLHHQLRRRRPRL